MGWTIECCNTKCGTQTQASEIVDLIKNHTHENGKFRCDKCGNYGYIKKSFKLQEPGQYWKPYLKGAIRLKREGAYQPFVFLVSYKPNDEPTNVWFSYFKDLRDTGGKLKLGYGPGGPPALDFDSIIDLLKQLIDLDCLSKEDVIKTIKDYQK